MSLAAMGWLQNSLGFDITGEWTQIVHLNVGGIQYTCQRRTFKDYQHVNPIFDDILNDTSNAGKRSEDGCYVIDRDGSVFRHILNFMRSGGQQLMLPDNFDEWELLVSEVKYFALTAMEEAITSHHGYRIRCFRKDLPHGVYLMWAGKNSVSLVPGLPSLKVHDGALSYEGRYVGSCEEAVTILIHTYGMHVEHWKTEVQQVQQAAAGSAISSGSSSSSSETACHSIFFSKK